MTDYIRLVVNKFTHSMQDGRMAFSQIVSTFKCIAFIERNSLNRMHKMSELDSFYEKMDSYFKRRIQDFDSLGMCSAAIIGFAKVLWFPTDFYDQFKQRFIEVLVNEYKELRNRQLFAKLKKNASNLSDLQLKLSKFKPNELCTAEEIAEKNKLSVEISVIQKSIKSEFGKELSSSNSIFTQSRAINALSKFTVHLKDTDPEFLDDFAQIVAGSVHELFENKEILPLLSDFIQPLLFVNLMRLVQKLRVHFVSARNGSSNRFRSV